MLQLAQLFIVGSFGRDLEAFEEAGSVPDNPGRNTVGKLLRAHQIAAPDLQGIDAKRASAHVHEPLGHEGRNRSADAAIRSGWRLAGGHAPDGAAVGPNFVRTGQEADDLHGLEARGPRIDRIGADVANHVGFQPDGHAVDVKAHLGVDDFGECLAAARYVLETVRGPFHRTAKFLGGDAEQDLLGI